MSFFTKLFTGSPAADKVAATLQDSAKSAFTILDEAFETSQEKTEAKQKATAVFLDAWKTTQNESTGTAEARRWFLQQITCYVMAACSLCILASITGKQTIAENIVTYVKAFYIGEAFVAAYSFYFLAHIIKSFGAKQ